MNYGLGWNPDLEYRHDAAFAQMCRAPAPTADVPIPDTVDPPLPVNNQGPIGSCCGNALDKATEFDEWIATGNVVNLSARFQYLSARIEDGTNDGPDAGASISGGALASTKRGCCLESTFPYWNFAGGERFSTDIPREALFEGQQHRLQSQCDIPSWDAAAKFIGSGQGGVIFGIIWYSSLANYDGSQQVITNVSGRSLGGHALCCCGYETIAGQKIPKIWNSHSEQWGKGGKMLMDPALWERLVLGGPFGARGVSKLHSFTRRPFKSFQGAYG